MKYGRTGYRTNSRYCGWLLLLLAVCLASVMTPVSAYHPISSRLDFVGSYPAYPDINYGSGDQAAC